MGSPIPTDNFPLPLSGHLAAIQKLRWNERPTDDDLDALERILADAGTASPDELSRMRSSGELGIFVRSLVGLDRQAAKRAFDGFLAGKTLTANQIQFVNVVVDSLTQSGWMSPAQLYESPFTDFSPRGVEGVFDPSQVTQLFAVLESIRQAAGVMAYGSVIRPAGGRVTDAGFLSCFADYSAGRSKDTLFRGNPADCNDQ